MKKISLAHSPDSDDIFMYYAVKFGWAQGVEKRFAFENEALDIETLNVEAKKGTYDATAISFALYPYIYEDYALLRCAASFGQGYGPKLVRLEEKKLKRNFKVALSGAHTTNALLFRIAYPEARITYMNFLEIEQAVLDGTVDAGVLIHESILMYDEKLTVEKELWDVWEELSGGGIPLPLGGMAIRRSLVLLDAIGIEEVLIQAVKLANQHKQELSKMLTERELVRIGDEKLEKYLNMYAGEESASLNEEQLQAINKLFEIGYEHGFYPEKITTQDHLLPTEYKELRFS